MNDKPNDEKLNKIKKAKAKKKLRRIVYGSMALGGAIGLAGLNAQAHGNASSHKEAQLSWNFDDFVIEREVIQETYPREISVVTNLRDNMEILERNRDSFRQPGNFNFDALNDDEVPKLGGKVDNILSDQLAANQILSNQLSINSVKQITALTPTTKEVLQLLQSNDIKGAIKVIENTPKRDDVLSRYSIVQLDLYNYGAIDQFSTATFADEIVKITKAGLHYQKTKAPKELAARAGLLHNLASAVLPDKGSATAYQFKTCRNAAIEALKIRKGLEDKVGTGIAEYMVAMFDYRANDFAAAEKRLEQSLELLDGSYRVQDIAWSKLYLGLSKIAQGDRSGQKLINQVRNEFKEAGNSYGLTYLDSVTKKT